MEGNHLEVFRENCLDLIKNFQNREYDVIFNYICTPKDTEYIRNNLKDTKIKLCILLTDEENIIKGDKMRSSDCQMGEHSILLWNEFKVMDYDKRYYLDTTSLSTEEIVREIIQNDKYLLWA